MSTTNLSIVIPTYNNASLLSDCVDCIIDQEGIDLHAVELIIVDNNSTDSTKEIVEEFQSRQLPFNIIYSLEKQQGVTFARITGARQVKHDLVVFIDDDVRLSPSWCREAIEFFQRHPQAGVVGGKIDIQYMDTPTEAVSMCETVLCRVDHGSEEKQAWGETPGIYLVGATFAFRKVAMFESGWLENSIFVGRQGKALSSGEDTEIFFRIKNKGWELWYSPKLYAKHEVYSKRMSIAYLCKLHRGISRSSAQLRAVANQGDVSFASQIQNLVKDLTNLAKRSGSWVFHDLIKQRKIGNKRFIQIFEAYGRVESSLEYLFENKQKYQANHNLK